MNVELGFSPNKVQPKKTPHKVNKTKKYNTKQKTNPKDKTNKPNPEKNMYPYHIDLDFWGNFSKNRLPCKKTKTSL